MPFYNILIKYIPAPLMEMSKKVDQIQATLSWDFSLYWFHLILNFNSLLAFFSKNWNFFWCFINLIIFIRIEWLMSCRSVHILFTDIAIDILIWMIQLFSIQQKLIKFLGVFYYHPHGSQWGVTLHHMGYIDNLDYVECWID